MAVNCKLVVLSTTLLIIMQGLCPQSVRAQDRPGSAPPDLVIHVAPDGKLWTGAVSNAGPGDPTANRIGPLRSVAAAVDRVGELRRQSSRKLAIVVELGPGVHRLDRPVALGAGHSGTAGRPLIIRGQSDGSSIIRGSVEPAPLPGPSAAIQRRLPPAAHGHVRSYRLPPVLPPNAPIDRERFHPVLAAPLSFEVFDADGALWPARWPNEGWARVGAVLGDRRFEPAAPGLAGWAGEPELWAAGAWEAEWSYESQRVGRVDPTLGTLELATPPHYGLKPNARFFIYHALAELDAPGEWYREPGSNALHLWPRAGRADARVEVSVCDSAFIMTNASHVRLEHLTIERFRGDGVQVAGGEDVVIADSTIHWVAGRGASFVDARDSGVRTSMIADTGEGGVVLSGGDRAKLAPARLFASDNKILRFSRLGRTYKPAVQLDGVGNIASGNLIAGSPHVAILFKGNDHIIEFNEITDVVTDSSDAGAIYTGRDWAARGTVIQHNFLHDLKPRPGSGFETKGVYLDDMASGITVRSNLFLRVDQPVFIGGGRDNVVETNVFIASEPAVHIDGRGSSWAKDAITNPDSELQAHLRAVPYRSPVWRARYPALAGILQDAPAAAKRNEIRRNLFVGSEAFRFVEGGDRAAQSIGPDHIVTAPPQAVLTAKSAADVGKSLETELQRFGVGAIGMDRMDRSGRLQPISKPPLNRPPEGRL